MILNLFAAATEESSTGLGALGVDPKSFIFQIITFILVFILLKKFAFKRIGELLEQRRKVIDDGIRLGQKMEAEKAKLDENITKVMRDARVEADRIIADGHKEAREVVREAEKSGQKKVEAMIVDAEARLEEEANQAKRKLEKEIAGLVSEATEAVVGESMDDAKDSKLIDKALKDRA